MGTAQKSKDFDGLPRISNIVFDDDGRLKRTGTVWTASAHIITAVIGSGVLSLAWAVAQLGWIAGPAAMLMFAFVTYYTSTLLSSSYRTGDSLTGRRNYTYMEAVRTNLSGVKFRFCGLVQYANMAGTAIGYTIASAISMMAMQRTSCHRKRGANDPCKVNGNPYMIAFGVAEIIFSQIPDLHQVWWLSIVAAVMSFTYSTIGLAFGIAKVIENKKFKGGLTGVRVGTVKPIQKVWRSFQALGNIAFAYSFALVLIEIQDTIKSPPAEDITMRKATLLSLAVTTIFYMLCGCFGYAAFGDLAPGNLLTGGYFTPFWLLDIGNLAIVIHLVGAYQVFCQPLFGFVEKQAEKRFPDSRFITREIKIQFIPGMKPYYLNLFRLVWRTAFVLLTTLISMIMPFFNDVVGLLGALAFWPLTVFFPVEMYIEQKAIKKWSASWVCNKVLSMACLIVSMAAMIGSVVGIASDLQTYKPFKTNF